MRILEKLDEFYTLVDRETDFEPYVLAGGYNKDNGTWCHGTYFSKISDALKYYNLRDKGTTKKDVLKAMDVIIASTDDFYIQRKWLTYGLPDGYNGDDLEEIVSDGELYQDMVELFVELMQEVEL